MIFSWLVSPVYHVQMLYWRGLEYADCILCRGLRLRSKKSRIFAKTKPHLIPRLKFLRTGNYKEPLYCYHAQIALQSRQFVLIRVSSCCQINILEIISIP